MAKETASNSTIMEAMCTALSRYTDPAAVSAQIVTKMITSKVTKSLVRKIIIDPVQGRLIPKITGSGWDKSREIFNAFLTIFDDEALSNILNINTNKTKELKDYLANHSPYYPFYIWKDDAEDENDYTKIIRYNDAILYIAVKFNRNKEYVTSVGFDIYFISPTHKVYEYFVDEIEKAREYIDHGYANKFNRRIKVIQMGAGGRGRFQVNYATVPTTIILAPEVNDALETVIKTVGKSDELRNTYEVNKTVGVLLWGPPGTGKSTIVRYLAMRLKRSLILVGADDLNEAINYTKENSRDDSKFIILIEDIDFKFVDRRKLAKGNTKSKANKDEDDEGGLAMNPMFAQTDTLFQVLDGVLADSNLMVCATTNYKDRLDPALIRPGRFDHDIEVVGLAYHEAVQVCEQFNVKPEDIELEKFPIPINPGALQAKIIKFKTLE
jgi:hypothetical protein